MRFSQPKGEATEFLSLFEGILHEINPEYERNISARGLRSEFLREVTRGVFASHNVYCIRGRYHHCFCLTLHRELPKPYLLSPFTVGGRFDRNHCINMAFQRDLKQHIILSDSHEFRKGCDRIMRRCSIEAETHLLPHYLSIFRESKDALLLLAKAINGDVVIPGVIHDIRGSEYLIGEQDCDMLKFSSMLRDTALTKEEFVKTILVSKPELFLRLRKKSAIDESVLA